MTATPDTPHLDRPAHDAVTALIDAELDRIGVLGQYDRHEAEQRVEALFAALFAVDQTRYQVRPSTLAGVRARGWTVDDTWTGESLDWCSGRVQADRLAAEQNTLNAQECQLAIAAGRVTA